MNAVYCTGHMLFISVCQNKTKQQQQKTKQKKKKLISILYIVNHKLNSFTTARVAGCTHFNLNLTDSWHEIDK